MLENRGFELTELWKRPLRHARMLRAKNRPSIGFLGAAAFGARTRG
jgi:hypothetical protein